MSRCRAVVLIVLLALAACTTARHTEPSRTATEQLLLSSAVDHALARLHLTIPQGTRLWVDASDFQAFDGKYAIGAIRDYLLRHGGRMAAKRADADAIVEIRSGALSINQAQSLVGVPSIPLPIPLTGILHTPELALLKRGREQGIAKIGMTIYDAHTGALLPWSPRGPFYGRSHSTRWVVLFLVSWTDQDILPASQEKSTDWRLPPPVQDGGPAGP